MNSSSPETILKNASAQFRFFIETMGCKANVFDSLVMENKLRSAGGLRTQEREEASVFILNSCTVTSQADQKALRILGQLKDRRPEVITVMTGCLAEVSRNDAAFSKNPDIDVLLPNTKRNHIEKLVRNALRINSGQSALDLDLSECEDSDEVFWGQLPIDSDHTRAFLKVQEGCNDFCTYCIIPMGRGKSRSVALEKILSEVNRICAKGLQEVVLTGTNLADYGKEWGLSFDDLVATLLRETDLPRLRLSSLDPSEISPGLLQLMVEKYPGRLMPHFHISLQSPVSRVLRAMKRNYRQQDVGDCLNQIYRANPEIFVGMDVISGFPSETLTEHQEGLEYLASLPWTRLHVFPYSERKGTPALKIPGSVPVQERKRRSQELMALSNARYRSFCEKFLGRVTEGVLVERVEIIRAQNRSDEGSGPLQSSDQGQALATAAGDVCHVLGHAPHYLRFLGSFPIGPGQPVPFQRNQTVKILAQSLLTKPSQDFTIQGQII